ncbi:MAG: hypothetical protein RR228_00880 [Bacilli bacterium]
MKYNIFIKYFIIFLILSFLVCGCSKKESKEEVSYNNAIKELNSYSKNNLDSYPFDILVNVEKISTDNLLYCLIIDNVKESINSMSAIIIHDKLTKDVFPSIGYFDEKINLLPSEGKKGLSLCGYINYSGTIDNFRGKFTAFIKYKDNKNYNRRFYYIKQY